ncbi:TCR/Tet family MFS transporter [Parvularcula oceani]|uniref:TCR/Tet family MFS transporter n=1 Tax=Parvularcula oceani TaxID=1247963 RepID=UPI0004E167DA|nr:tetracycline resistance MFS efflux pump [Parvularcula oceani]
MTAEAPGAPRAAILFIFITVLMSIVGFGIIIPVMPELIMELTGRTEAGAAQLQGYLLGVYGLMQLIMSPVLGALSDRFGRRPVILTSVAAYSLDFLLMALAPTYAWLFLGRTLSGATAATYATANAFIADVSPPEKRAGNFGLLGAAFGLGFIVGPALGGWLGDIDTRLPFFAASGVAFMNFLFGLFVLPETLRKERRRRFEWRRATPLGGLRSVGRHPVVLGVLAAYFLMQLAHGALPAIWAFFGAEKFGWGPREIGLSLAFVGVTAALVQGGLTRVMIPRIGQQRAVYLGMATMTASFLGYAFATPSGAWVYLWIVVGAFGGFMMPAMQALMSAATPETEQGELQGAIASVMSITTVVSPLVMTQVFYAFTRPGADTYFPGAPMLLAAVVLALALLPFRRTMRREGVRRRVAAAGAA